MVQLVMLKILCMNMALRSFSEVAGEVGGVYRIYSCSR